ncbi:MAG TPA: hypothetical protein ENK62_05670, partial [Chromatiales bacterium]|nr:hypothetical protein [Chromatiales bacterium]
MHRWTLLASAFALLGLTSVSATPFNPAEFGGRDQGYLVPGVYFTSAADTSAVGLTNTCNAHQVHWVFTDTSGTVQGRGSFTILPTETRPFVLAQALPASAVGRFGTLMFVSDTDGDGKLTSADEQCLVVEAFHADLTRNDAVFLPVWPFNTYDFPGGPGTGINDLSIMVPGMLSRLSSGIEDEPGADVRTIYLRYSIGG